MRTEAQIDEGTQAALIDEGLCDTYGDFYAGTPKYVVALTREGEMRFLTFADEVELLAFKQDVEDAPQRYEDDICVIGPLTA